MAIVTDTGIAPHTEPGSRAVIWGGNKMACRHAVGSLRLAVARLGTFMPDRNACLWTVPWSNPPITNCVNLRLLKWMGSRSVGIVI